MASLEFRDLAKVCDDGLDTRELCHVHVESFGVVNLWHEEHICKGKDITHAVLGTGLCDCFFEGCQTSNDSELGPSDLV